jgi:hypothetical protein
MIRTKYKRAIIGVEKKLGFLYVPSIGQELMPAETAKISVLLEGEEQQSLTYNKDHKRVYGLTSWYKKNKIEVGTVLNIELTEKLMRIFIANDSTIKITEQNENIIDLTGLSSSAKGNIVEDRIKELVLLYGQGLLNVYKPVIDNKGIDLIVMRDGVFSPIFLQVKSRFNANKRENLLIEVSDKTFTSHESFYVIGASFNPITLELDNKMLLIPSKVFEQKATPLKDYNKKRVSVSLKKDSKALWTNSFIDKSELVEKLMEKFEEMAKYIK